MVDNSIATMIRNSESQSLVAPAHAFLILASMLRLSPLERISPVGRPTSAEADPRAGWLRRSL
jgi:hypothetical protein